MQIVRDDARVPLFENMPIVPQSKSNEWYTPARYIEAARRVMGSIDLDPASCEMANKTVRATRFYCEKENGLVHDWTCKSMWLNPPYGKTDGVSNKEVWTRKLIHHYHSGDIAQAVLLVTAATENMWFQDLWQFPICFSVRNDRVRFYSPNGEIVEHAHGTAFVYLGPNESAFIEHFSPFGRIARAIDTPAPQQTTRSLWEVDV